MARYYFTFLWPDGKSDYASMFNSPDEHAACFYARLLINEIKESPDYSDPGLKMIVQNSNDDITEIIPF